MGKHGEVWPTTLLWCQSSRIAIKSDHLAPAVTFLEGEGSGLIHEVRNYSCLSHVPPSPHIPLPSGASHHTFISPPGLLHTSNLSLHAFSAPPPPPTHTHTHTHILTLLPCVCRVSLVVGVKECSKEDEDCSQAAVFDLQEVHTI